MDNPQGEVTGDQLLLIIGRKDVELEFTKRQVMALTQKVNQLVVELDELKNPQKENKDAKK